ncbi:hypothetical protein GCM10010112_46070 [Actinoplanes lobatus]|uniref:Uncharacterized protein n=1 Tax=Actinoplanes lobatus TaxID=113568 RepID=A0ABQ4ADL7_9ACTN|nr:hypothetical protein GCM10010112_46070 [Actinoplanes lobatus]GIE39020.1 hypothetical protein Alo02nite_19180 [Actinoplanes lobatus]
MAEHGAATSVPGSPGGSGAPSGSRGNGGADRPLPGDESVQVDEIGPDDAVLSATGADEASMTGTAAPCCRDPGHISVSFVVIWRIDVILGFPPGAMVPFENSGRKT